MNSLPVLFGLAILLIAGLIAVWLTDIIFNTLSPLIQREPEKDGKADAVAVKIADLRAARSRRTYSYTAADLLREPCFRNAEACATRLWNYVPAIPSPYAVNERVWPNFFDDMMRRRPSGSCDVDVTELDYLKRVGVEDLETRLQQRRSSITASASDYPVPAPKQNRITAPEMPIFVTQEDLSEFWSKYELEPKVQKDVIANADRINSKVEQAFVASRERFDTVQSIDKNNFEQLLALWRQHKDAWQQKRLSERHDVDQCLRDLGSSTDIEFRAELALRACKLPRWVPSGNAVEFDQETGILIVEHQFPNVEELNFFKEVETKNSTQKKPLNQKERRAAVLKLYPLLTLKIATDLAAILPNGPVRMIVVNGWVDLRNKSTGIMQRAFCSSLAAQTQDLLKIEFAHVDPVAAFSALKGNSSRSTEVTPIAPTTRIDMDDPRYIDGKEVLENMEAGENLASMDWEDFEHLCRELFERVFAAKGATVKVTQASRDQGVDAVINDPDPIMGGRIVVQAKRYVNVVDVSAVRDLAGTVAHEGAMKGLLVTTSHFGPDAYAFVQGKPLQLINGAELLGLLEKHGYRFRIDLEEARRIQRESGAPGFRSGRN